MQNNDLKKGPVHQLVLLVSFCLGFFSLLNAQSPVYLNRIIVSTDGVPRRISIYFPQGYNPALKYPIIIALHGQDNGTPSYQPSMGYLQSIAGMMSNALFNSSIGDSCIVACPESDSTATGGGNYTSDFNLPFNYLVPVTARDSMIRWYNIDTNRVYLNGFSNGGWMALYSGLLTYKLWKALFLWTPACPSIAWANGNFPEAAFTYSNAKYIPVCMTVGAADPNGYSLIDSVINRRLIEANGLVNFTVVPGLQHHPPPAQNMFSCIDIVNPLSRLDAGITEITSPGSNGIQLWSCDSIFTPTIRLMNRGTDTLTSVDILYQMDKVAPDTFSWKGNLVSLNSTEVNLNPITTTGTTHRLTVYTSSPNKGTDGNHLNDTLRETIQVEGLHGGLTFPLVEGFEGPNYQFEPDFDDIYGYAWKIHNPANDGSASCAYAPNYGNNQASEIADLTSVKPIDLSSSASPWLKFDRSAAYGQDGFAQAGYYDTLYVSISTDCGGTFNVLRSYAGAGLATVATTVSDFFPTNQSQWKTDSIYLGPYHSCTSAFIKFRSVNYAINNIFIDNINIYSGNLLDINNYSNKEYVRIFPNPMSESATVVFSNAGRHYIELYEITGRQLSFSECNENQYQLQRNNLAGGMYVVKILDENREYLSSLKICIQ